MARKNVKGDVKSDKKVIKKEVEEYSADESEGSGSSVSFSPTPGRKRNKASRATRDRPKKRNLIRWNEVYDQRCLLALQHVLSVKGIKIPWDEVGAKLGPTITEGAIVQHLAKLRTRLENDGVKVTPALQRGGRVRTSRAATDNNVKTVSAKGAVTKRTGSGTASNKKYSSIHDGKDDSKLDETSPRKGEAKAITATEKAENVSESIRAEIKTEPLSSGDSKNPGRLDLYKNDDDEETIGSNDTTEYSSGSEDDHEQDAVAIGAPFLELESSSQASAASSAVNSPARPMVIIPPRSLVVILLIGRTMAQCLAQYEENNCIEERRNLMGGDFSPDSYETASGSHNHQPSWTPGQAIEGPVNAYTGYDADCSTALQQDNSGLAMSSTSECMNHESIISNAQSDFAGYGMRNGPFDRDTGLTTSPQYGFGSQYRGLHGQGVDFTDTHLNNNTPMETAMSGYRYSVDDPFHYANDSSTTGFSDANVFGYQSNHGFPISSERSTSHNMAPSNVFGYPSSSGGQSRHTNRANAGSNSPSNLGHGTINEEVAGLTVDHFMGNTDPFGYNFNTNDSGAWGSFDHSNYPL